MTTLTNFAAQMPWIVSLQASLRRHLNRARIKNELATYTSRQLSELRLAPGDIPDIANGTYGRR